MTTLFLLGFVALLAESDVQPMPVPKAILGILFFGGVGIASCLGIFASSATLQQYAGVIGSNNPLVARVACLLGAIVGLFGATAFALNLAGVL